MSEYYKHRDYTNLNDQFFRRLVKELSRVTQRITYSYVCDSPDGIDNRYPLPHFILAINEARKKNPRTNYVVRYRLSNDRVHITIKTLVVQTPQRDGEIEIAIPRYYKPIAEAILSEVSSQCRHCKNNSKLPHPDYEHFFICDDCLLLRNRHLFEVIP